MSEELKRCPFCGGEAFEWRTNHRVFIQCSNYNANSHLVEVRATTREEAVELWNRRYVDESRDTAWQDCKRPGR